MEDTDTRVAIIRRVSRQLQQFLAGLSPAQLQQPSACDLWEVRDVVSHLAGGAERQVQSMLRGLQGESGPPQDFVSGDTAVMSAGNANRDIERRRELGEGLLPAFEAGYDRLHGLLSNLEPGQWETLCWHARRGAMPARDYLDLRIQELVIHDWDIRSVLDPEARLDAEGGAALLKFVPAWLRMTFRPGARLNSPVTYRFEIFGAGRRSHQVTATGDDFRMSAGDETPADLVAWADQESYLLFVYGRLSADAGVKSGRLDIAGPPALMGRFEEWFKGL